MSDDTSSRSASAGMFDLFSDGGETGELMRRFAWADSPLGPVAGWPKSLRTCVRIIMTSRQPMFVWWGPQLINLYNDAYLGIIGGKHPTALGRPASVVWHEIWDEIGPRADTAMRSNRGTYDEALLLIMQRHGYEEETYYTFSYSPVPDDDGSIGGIICANTDETGRIVDERRLQVLRTLDTNIARTTSWQETCALGAEALAGERLDLPFVLIYVVDEAQPVAHLAGRCGFTADHPLAAGRVSLAAGVSPWRLWEALDTQELQRIDVRPFHGLPPGGWPRPPELAVAVPLPASGESGRRGVLVVGLNPYRKLDGKYLAFLHLIAGQIAAGIAHAQAYESERRRAEALLELDRAKTLFFSNVSHELRTPLTLMLAPLEDGLADRGEPLTPRQRERQEMIHRNGQRLLKLVNSLLDFSRIEAGRMRAAVVDVDLAQATSDLASTFRSIIERAGMELRVDCPPLAKPVAVDPNMWENIVLNLLSNAFKHTFAGAISVSLRAVGERVELAVGDTGVGIAEDQLPRIFDRFHRIEGAPSRTHEGTGIGLALVQELVRLHGGTVGVTSRPGHGSTFTVSLPAVAASRHDGTPAPAAHGGHGSAARARAIVGEAARWLPGEGPAADDFGEAAAPARAIAASGRVLLADDNPDMRAYVQRLLRQRWQVDTVADGVEALGAARRSPPDLILSDVMMPRMDGIALLRELRGDPATRHIPVILLSARAGEEAGIEGLEAGADDYLTKPFSAQELIARVGAHLQLKRQRDEALRDMQSSTATLQLALDSARMTAWSYDPLHDTLLASRNLAAIFGLVPGQEMVSARAARELIHPEDVERHFAEVQASAREFRPYCSLFRLRRPIDGRWVWLEDRGEPHERDGRIYLSGVTVDVTQRMAAEDAIRTSEMLFRGIVHHSLAGIAETDADGRFSTVNDRYCVITGYERAELLELGKLDITHVEDRQRSAELIRDLAHGGTFFEIEKRYIRRDGLLVWVHNSVSGIRDRTGRLTRMVVVTIDITQRKQVEESLRRRTEQYATLLNQAPVGIYVVDADFRVQDVNPVAAPAFGAITGGLIGRDFAEIVHLLWNRPYAEEILRVFRGTLDTGIPFDASERLEQRRDRGSEECYEWRVDRILMPDGRFGLVCYFRDITRYMQAQASLARHAEDLRRANEELEHFASIASHDLQEPLRMISNYSELLQRKYGTLLDDRGSQYFNYIITGAVRMRALIHALREYSQLGQQGVTAVPASLLQIVQETIDVLQPEIHAKAAVITLDDLPPVAVDPVRIGQLFQNFIANALKFTVPDRPPRIRIDAEDAGHEWRLAITDNGIGIPEQGRERVFRIFQRLHRANEYAGSGIGLATCKKIVEQHGGRIGVESTLGAGSTFWFTLPKRMMPGS